jgi:hypothetical protein
MKISRQGKSRKLSLHLLIDIMKNPRHDREELDMIQLVGVVT